MDLTRYHDISRHRTEHNQAPLPICIPNIRIDKNCLRIDLDQVARNLTARILKNTTSHTNAASCTADQVRPHARISRDTSLVG